MLKDDHVSFDVSFVLSKVERHRDHTIGTKLDR